MAVMMAFRNRGSWPATTPNDVRHTKAEAWLTNILEKPNFN